MPAERVSNAARHSSVVQTRRVPRQNGSVYSTRCTRRLVQQLRLTTVIHGARRDEGCGGVRVCACVCVGGVCVCARRRAKLCPVIRIGLIFLSTRGSGSPGL